MTKDNKDKLTIYFIITLSIFLMFIIDYIIQAKYIWKSLIKILLFFIIPTLYIKRCNRYKKRYFGKISKKQAIRSIALGIFVYIFIIGFYLVIKNFIDLNHIQTILVKNLNVNRSNFIFVAFYIAFVNSLLEEYFFRGFIFLSLLKIHERKSAYIISAFLFAIYHVAIMANWFNIYLFILALIGLFIAGILFNWLDEGSKNIYNSWLVHMFANFAINTVGFIMFGFFK